MIELFEDYKNLNMLDRTFLMQNRSNANPINLKDVSITPNSEIYIEKVTPHNFTTAMALLEDETIGALVFRAHNRQLVMVTKDKQLIRKYGFWDEYMAILSTYAYSKCNTHYGNRYIRSEREAPIKTAVSRVIKSFYEQAPEGTKKKWDVLVIKKDPNVEQQRMDREEAKTGRVLTPHDAGYDNFIKMLNNKFKHEAEQYINSKRPDNQNIQDIGEYLLNNKKMDKIKVRGITYRLIEKQLEVGNKDYLSYMVYRTVDEENTPPKQYNLYIFLQFDGFMPRFIKAVPGDRWTTARMAKNDIGNSQISF